MNPFTVNGLTRLGHQGYDLQRVDYTQDNQRWPALSNTGKGQGKVSQLLHHSF